MAPPPPPSISSSSRVAHRLLSNRPPSLSPQLSPSSSSSSSTLPPSFLLPRNLYSFLPSSSSSLSLRSPPPPLSPSLLAWNDTRSVFSSSPLRMEDKPPPLEMEWWDEEEETPPASSEMGVSTVEVQEVVVAKRNPSLDSLIEEVKEKKVLVAVETQKEEGTSMDRAPHLRLPPHLLIAESLETVEPEASSTPAYLTHKKPFVYAPSTIAVPEELLFPPEVAARLRSERDRHQDASVGEENETVDTTPRVLLHNLPGTALPVDVQLLLLSVLGEEGEEGRKRLPNFTFLTSPKAPTSTPRIVSIRTTSLAQHHTLLHSLSHPSSLPLFAHSLSHFVTTASLPSSTPSQKLVGGNLVWTTDPNPERTAGSFVTNDVKEFELPPEEVVGTLEDPREEWERPRRERKEYVDEQGRRHLLLRGVKAQKSNRKEVQKLLRREGLLVTYPGESRIAIRSFTPEDPEDDSVILHIIIAPPPPFRLPSTDNNPFVSRANPELPQTSRLFRPTSTMSQLELDSDSIPRLGGRPVWIAETSKEEIEQLERLEVEGRDAQLRKSSLLSKQNRDAHPSSSVNSHRHFPVLDASSQQTIDINPPPVSNPSSSSSLSFPEEPVRPPPPPQTFADFYKPSFQSFKALRLFQLRSKTSNPSYPGSGNGSIASNLLTSFFPSHHPFANFFLPTALFGSPSSRAASSSSTSSAVRIPGGYHQIYNALLVPDFELDPSSSSSSSSPTHLNPTSSSPNQYSTTSNPSPSRSRSWPLLTDPPQPRERTVFVGGFPNNLTLGELRIWLTRRSLVLGDWTDCVRIVPLRSKRDDWKGGGKFLFGTGKEIGYARLPGGRKTMEMKDWVGKKWFETGGVRLEKMHQMADFALGEFLITLPTEADAQRVVRTLDRYEFRPARLGDTISHSAVFPLSARIVHTDRFGLDQV